VTVGKSAGHTGEPRAGVQAQLPWRSPLSGPRFPQVNVRADTGSGWFEEDLGKILPCGMLTKSSGEADSVLSCRLSPTVWGAGTTPLRGQGNRRNSFSFPQCAILHRSQSVVTTNVLGGEAELPGLPGENAGRCLRMFLWAQKLLPNYALKIVVFPYGQSHSKL
jgi:hypothetical protein